jgi:hypothetical protein
VFSRGPIYGETIDFYVNGTKVCSAPVGNTGSFYAVCQDPNAVAQALQAGWFEARADAVGLSASAGVVQTDGETAIP